MSDIKIMRANSSMYQKSHFWRRLPSIFLMCLKIIFLVQFSSFYKGFLVPNDTFLDMQICTHISQFLFFADKCKRFNHFAKETNFGLNLGYLSSFLGKNMPFSHKNKKSAPFQLVVYC